MKLSTPQIMLRFACALAPMVVPAVAHAQEIAAEDVGEPGDESVSGGRSAAGGRVVTITPYIEAAQVLTAQLDPASDVVTYTSLAAGVDAVVAGRNSAASVSLRYERRFGWSDDAVDGDTVSGVARASLALVPRAVTLEAGALASRTRVEGNGGTSVGGFAGNDSSTSQVYAGYVGPSINARAGDFDVQGRYLLGYTRVEEPDALALAAGAQPVDLFDDSITHSAQASINLRPDTALPIGLGIGGGWNEQNISNLDQRIRDRFVRGGITVPVTQSVALVGGVGYEDVEISSRDALRDGNGNPVIGSDGRYVTNDAAPRQIAYQTDGLIWDAGVMWRPSNRTSLEAYVGRRYGSTTYYGTFAYAPNARSSLSAAVYDTVTGLGGQLTNSLAGLPSQFSAFRKPISGEIGGCVASLEGGNCLNGALGSFRSSVYRSRGAATSYAMELGRTQLGAGVGYDERKFIAAPGTVLAAANGVTDQTIWLAAYASTRLDEQSSISANAAANWFESGFDLSSDAIGYSTSLSYTRRLIRGLTGTAAVGLDGITRETLPDFMSASALLGMRYSF
ncbi:MAG: preprotein translocase subunit YajC [Croceibacterium sp.]